MLQFGQTITSRPRRLALGEGRFQRAKIGCIQISPSLRIEQIIGKPVITSSQAQVCSCLRCAGLMDEFEGFGQILKHSGTHLRMIA